MRVGAAYLRSICSSVSIRGRGGNERSDRQFGRYDAAPSSDKPGFFEPGIVVPTVADVSAFGSVRDARFVVRFQVGRRLAGSIFCNRGNTAGCIAAAGLPPVQQTNRVSKVVLTGVLSTRIANTGRLVVKCQEDCREDLAWPGQAANSSDNSDQQRKKDVAILALDAVFAQYGR